MTRSKRKTSTRSSQAQIPRSPNQQAHVERVIQTLKHEVLNGFCIVSNRHMDLILRTAMDWYNKRRGHSARDDLPPARDRDPPLLTVFPAGEIVCDSELGGHLKSYRRVAEVTAAGERVFAAALCTIFDVGKPGFRETGDGVTQKK